MQEFSSMQDRGMSQELSKYFVSGLRRFFSGIMLSRISGLGRDLVMAYAFGDHPAVAAFLIAFRFSNLLRRFFGEGPLQSAFIPHFEGLRSQGEEAAYGFFRKLTGLLSGILLSLVVVLELGLGSTLSFLSPEAREIVSLTTWMLPSLLFICLYGLNVSFLQCHNAFFVPSIAPFLCNSMWILGAFYLKGKLPSEAMQALAKWVLIGFVLQWAVTLPQMRRFLKGKIAAPLMHKEVKKLAKTFSLGALGVGAIQINTFLDVIFARCAHVSGPVYLWYANRFQQLALAMLGIAAVNTLVPLLSRAIKQGEMEKGKEVFTFGCRRVLTMMLPMTLAIYTLGFSAIDLVFGRGNFSLYAVNQTTGCLAAYGLGLIPSTLIMLYSAVLYAEGNFRIPTLFSLMTVGVNLGLNTLFVFGLGLGPISTALATSLGAWCNYFALRQVLLRKGWQMGYSFRSLSHLLGAALVASFITFSVEPVLRQVLSSKLLLFIIPGCLFVGVLALYALVFNHRDLKALAK